jgi:hypothetical protein
LGQPRPASPLGPRPDPSSAQTTESSSFSSAHVQEYVHGSLTFPPSPIYSVILSLRHEHRSCSVFSRLSIQEIHFPSRYLNPSNESREPNANRWHTPPDLPPQTISMRTKESTSFPLRCSFTFHHKV